MSENQKYKITEKGDWGKIKPLPKIRNEKIKRINIKPGIAITARHRLAVLPRKTSVVVFGYDL